MNKNLSRRIPFVIKSAIIHSKSNLGFVTLHQWETLGLCSAYFHKDIVGKSEATQYSFLH